MLACHNGVDPVLVEMVKVNHASSVILPLWIFPNYFLLITLKKLLALEMEFISVIKF